MVQGDAVLIIDSLPDANDAHGSGNAAQAGGFRGLPSHAAKQVLSSHLCTLDSQRHHAGQQFNHVTATAAAVKCPSALLMSNLSAAMVCRERDVLVGERWVKIRYDDTYHIYRPPRAHHCRVLNVVIARFDHYCPWTGTAIGLRNYRPFVLFLLFCTLSTMHGIAFCVLHIIHHVRETGQESSPDPGGIQGVAEDPTQPERRSTTSSLLEILPTPIMLIVLAGAHLFQLLLLYLSLFRLMGACLCEILILGGASVQPSCLKAYSSDVSFRCTRLCSNQCERYSRRSAITSRTASGNCEIGM